jgi:hypothetical protein
MFFARSAGTQGSGSYSGKMVRRMFLSARPAGGGTGGWVIPKRKNTPRMIHVFLPTPSFGMNGMVSMPGIVMRQTMIKNIL